MELSILVTSFQRASLLKWFFVSMLRQTIDFQYEIIVLNDGTEDDTKDVCTSFSSLLPIKYVFTGKRNKNGIVWRCPLYPLNIGIKMAQGKHIIISCAEMYLIDDIVKKMVTELNSNPNQVVTTYGKDDISRRYLNFVETNNGGIDPDLYQTKYEVDLCTDYPFFMAVNKDIVKSIGGYDEDFIGCGYDDTDFARRLKQMGLKQTKLPLWVIHLYHPRIRVGIPDYQAKFEYNKKLYDTRNNITVRNVGREWGVFDET